MNKERGGVPQNLLWPELPRMWSESVHFLTLLHNFEDELAGSLEERKVLIPLTLFSVLCLKLSPKGLPVAENQLFIDFCCWKETELIKQAH